MHLYSMPRIKATLVNLHEILSVAKRQTCNVSRLAR
jgi:hypothetical protein